MKKLAFYALLSAGLIFSACRKDEDDNGGTALTGLAAFLNGEFEVTRADYNGSLQNQIIGTVPLVGTGSNTTGSYVFDSRNKTAVYTVSSTMSVSILSQTLPVPINVNGSGDITVNSETQFVIDDPNYGLMTYNITNKTANSMVATTRYQNDTTFGTIDLLMDVHLQKK